MKTNKVFALDLGTTKFCLATLKTCSSNKYSGIEKISVNAAGMRRGMLTDFEKAEKSLHMLIDMAENEWLINISKVVVGIAGSHLQSNVFETTLDVPKNIVKQSHLDQLQSFALSQKSHHNKENLHAIPIHYKLDDRETTSAPLGFSTDQITGKFFRIEADKHYLNDVITLCNHCGLEVINLYAEPYASALATLTEKEKQHGVLIADIGGGTTDGIIFYQGVPSKLFTINIGGMLMTHDLSIGLGISHEVAEQLKHKIGLDKTKLTQDIFVDNIHKQTIKIASDDFYMMLFSRVLELTQLIKENLEKFELPLLSGVVITGGGAEVQGIEKIMSYILKLPVHKTRPRPFHYLIKSSSSSPTNHPQQMASKYSTVTGMLILESLSQVKSDDSIRSGFFEKYFHSFLTWIKEIS